MAQVLKHHGVTWEHTKERKLTPVLAVGSNAAPVQLARKFPPSTFPDGVVIPVLRCVLPDFDVVYAPLISSYGSCTGECFSHTSCNTVHTVSHAACMFLTQASHMQAACFAHKLAHVPALILTV